MSYKVDSCTLLLDVKGVREAKLELLSILAFAGKWWPPCFLPWQVMVAPASWCFVYEDAEGIFKRAERFCYLKRTMEASVLRNPFKELLAGGGFGGLTRQPSPR